MSTVVTSENLAEFNAQKLGLAVDAEPVVADETTEEVVSAEPTEVVEEQSEPQAEEKAVTDERKPNPKLEKRFSELTKQRELARQEAERERQRAADLEKRIADLEKTSGKAQSFEEVDAEPQPHQFDDAFEYAKALSEWSVENALKQQEKQKAEAKLAEERQAQLQAWAKRIEEAKAELPDYEEMIESAEVSVSDQVRDAIIESDVGPRILYHLAENPEFAEQLATFSTAKALREIGKLEARFEKKDESPKSTPSKAVATKSKAPAPINPLRATSSAADMPIGSDGQFHGTYQQWKEARKAGKIR